MIVLLPVGIPGSGKTYYKDYLKNEICKKNC